VMRDNLLVEFGLFAGALGRRRVFFVCPNSPALDLPSDLAGIVMATYDAARAQGDATDRAAAVQRACRTIRDAIQEEWASDRGREEQRLSQVRATEEFQAAQRLYRAAARLRDALLFVQRDAFAAFTDREAFDAVKAQTCREINSAVDSIVGDATGLGVQPQVDRLRQVTTVAVVDLPFPAELSHKPTDTERALGAGMGALTTFLGGGDPVGHISDSATGEARARLTELNRRYSEWWDAHSANVREATVAMQDALMDVTIRIASGQGEAHAALLRTSEP
jgi:hypothetical protein